MYNTNILYIGFKMDNNKENNETSKTSATVIKKNTVKRCSLDGCNTKLKMSDWACKCGLVFCSKHRIKEKHDCFSLVSTDVSYSEILDGMKCVADKLDHRI